MGREEEPEELRGTPIFLAVWQAVSHIWEEHASTFKAGCGESLESSIAGGKNTDQRSSVFASRLLKLLHPLWTSPNDKRRVARSSNLWSKKARSPSVIRSHLRLAACGRKFWSKNSFEDPYGCCSQGDREPVPGDRNPCGLEAPEPWGRSVWHHTFLRECWRQERFGNSRHWGSEYHREHCMEKISARFPQHRHRGE